jgi:N-acetylmuramoyl-L-alanine amidase/Bacterial Ig domain
MAARLGFLLVASLLAGSLLAPAAGAAPTLRPPVTWLKGEGNFTKSHRSPGSIDCIVVHVTEGQFWGSVRWLQSPRAHASSHFIVSRGGKIVQLVHTSDIAWHAGNWKTNVESVGIEHEGFTYGPDGFTTAQYRSSARLAAWIARRALMPIDRRHIIGHAQVPAPGGGLGGSGHHTDPGPRWNWNRYLALVRAFAHGSGKPSVIPLLPPGRLRGVVPWSARASGGIQRVEFSVDGRVVWVDRRAPFAYAGGRGLNTTRLGNGSHVLQVHGVAGPGRYDIARKTIVVDNRSFALTSAGARPWTKVRAPVRLRVRPWGAKARAMTFRVDGRTLAIDRRAPFVFAWSPARAKAGKHVLEVSAGSVDGRSARLRIPVVVAAKAAPRKPRPAPVPVVPLRIVSQSVVDGQLASGFVLWRVELNRPARVDFLVDGSVRGTDVAGPYTLGWNTAAETPGAHVLTARARGRDGRIAEASVTVTVPAAAAGTAAP